MIDDDGSTMTRDFDRVAFVALVGAAFLMPFSLPGGRFALAIASVAATVQLVRARRWPVITLSEIFAVAFLVVTVIVTINGVNPELGVPKLRKLLWFLAIPFVATTVSSPDRLRTVLMGFALGCCVLSAELLVMNPIHAAGLIRAGTFDAMGPALIDQGSMTHGQRLMVGVLIAVGLAPANSAGRQRWKWWLLTAVMAAALIINLKRGSWICTGLGLMVLFLLRGQRRRVLVLALTAVALLALPPVRVRLGEFKREFAAGHGGRVMMWDTVAPALIKKYPWGIGYRSLTNKIMLEHAHRVELDRDHLHSNIAQILVATGWLGFGLYALWMGSALGRGAVVAVRARRRRTEGAIVVATAWVALLSICANGVIEYNIGDAEIVLIYVLMLGVMSALHSGGTTRDQSPCPVP